MRAPVMLSLQKGYQTYSRSTDAGWFCCCRYLFFNIDWTHSSFFIKEIIHAYPEI